MQRRVPDNRLARELVGYEPRLPIESIIAAVVEDTRAAEALVKGTNRR